MKLTRYALTLVAAAALAGCGSTVKLDEPAPVKDISTTAPTGNTSQGKTEPLADSRVSTVDLFSELSQQVKDKRVIYFDFDSDVVKEEYRGLVDLHARRLKAKPQAALMLEGHTDERGGREYNLALGQRRAESVAKSLTLLGTAANQVEAVSFGKERPAVQGSTEEAWAKNRRVELKDK
ncbi:peptidoglycan-associated lipoprotein Pal [Roseateles saccharophilus]|uniref:Peptidoglycan-associated lipoprotein n=1 Tax=Roseateles saccharophilus TaxID=304 RepID=A0A4R3UJ89_ROSSA|nr:peptidoglycan-associated lipoprotein Pal [Roseateles saccharophilus]MDG0834314.1 peptidoglycan-associated lipoprotein Pal [Roseateles saccharophilus]TCU90677.1 peptidoglycan-associated lipoprotein [Roseateles saccharophilus]